MVKVKTKKKGENYHDRRAVLYLSRVYPNSTGQQRHDFLDGGTASLQ